MALEFISRLEMVEANRCKKSIENLLQNDVVLNDFQSFTLRQSVSNLEDT